MGAPAQPAAAPTAAPAAGREYHYDETTGTKTGADDGRMIIYNASLSLVVKDAQSSLEEIKGIAQSLGGYISQTQIWREEEQLRGTITLRVEARSLADALTRLRGIAVRVEREGSNSQDVTEEYTDLESRLRNLEATETELLELLKTVRERTGKAEDILSVHQRVSEIRGQIEQVKGRMQYLGNTAQLATITVELIPDVLTKPITPTNWQPQATLSNALRALASAMQSIVDAAIWIAVYIVPILAILLVPLGLLWLAWRARRKDKTTTAAS